MSKSPAPRALVIIGDSLTVACQDRLADLARDASVAFDLRAEIGRTCGTARAILLSMSASSIVIALGTNDYNLPAVVIDQLIDDLVEAVGSESNVWWVDLGMSAGRGQVFNAALRQATERYRHLRLIEWSAAVDAHPGLLAADGVHLTELGSLAFANLIASKVFE